jgi:dihydrofolate synthase/folylpolyglutamate synthase
MDYDSATKYLYGLERFGMKLGLNNITELLDRLGNPHAKLKCIHVSGTNGKGSVCAYIASVLQAQGYKVGLFTSPHLVSFTERIKVDGSDIGEDDVLRLTDEIRSVAESMASESRRKHPTFFEFTTAMAFRYFEEQNVDFAVLEVGLGGRLDATNVVTPLVSVITRIALEHTEHLGKEPERIAWEKAGIIKEGRPVVISETRFNNVFKDVAKKKGAEILFVGRDVKFKRTDFTMEHQTFTVNGRESHRLRTGLLGRFQVLNAATAVATVEVLQDLGVKITTSAIRRGIWSTRWPGRFEVVKTRPAVILDCAHNPDAARALAESLRELKLKRITFVLGILKDKDVEGYARQLGPLTGRLVVSAPRSPRALPPEDIAGAFSAFTSDIEIAASVGEAVGRVLSASKPDGTICIAGSIYTVGEAITALRRMKIGKIGTVMYNLRQMYSVGAFPGKDVEATTLKKEERDPFRVLIATILSHRTRDENTHTAVERLFGKYNTPKKISKAKVREIEKLIRPAGFYKVKAKRVKDVSKIILEKFEGEVPRDFEALMSLPSVGRKTANCVLVYGFGIDAIPVDTHVHRISNRLGLVETKTPDETEMALTSFVPRKYWLDLNEFFVRFGQETCRPIGPRCKECPTSNVCDYYSERYGDKRDQ